MLTPKEKIELVIQRGYYTKDGILYNNKNEKIKYACDTHGYPMIFFRLNCKQIIVRIHRLVAYHKYGDVIFNKNVMVRHLDDDKLNFKESNIAIGNHKDNYYDMTLEKRIGNTGKNKLSLKDIEYIKNNHINNNGKYTSKQLGKMFNRHFTTILRYVRGELYNIEEHKHKFKEKILRTSGNPSYRI